MTSTSELITKWTQISELDASKKLPPEYLCKLDLSRLTQQMIVCLLRFQVTEFQHKYSITTFIRSSKSLTVE